MTSILLATSNGTGMGHLTRQAAVALALAREHDATLFSLSLGLPLATELGIPGEYCPSYDRPWIASRDWHAYLRERLVAIVRETGSEVVVFDGVAPYPGIGLASEVLRDVGFVWLRRGMWQKGANRQQLRKRHFFDLTVEPGDFGGAADMGPTAKRHDATKVGPISILETLDLLPRDEARQRLGLPHGRPVALVTLGSGMLGDVAGPGRRSVSTFLDKTEEWHVAVTRSPVAINEVPFEQASRITEIRDVYPLAIYLKAFDLAVSSAGYNAVHEMLPAGIPSVLVANTSTRTDDQVARASQVEEEGLALSVADTDLDGLEAKLVSLLDSDLRSRVGSKAAATRGLLTGASEVGALSVALAGRGPSRRPGLKTIASHQVQRAKDAVKDLLGEKRTAELKKALGRGPSQTHQRARVQIVDDLSADAAEQPMHLAVVESVTSDELRAAGPVEHLLAESSGNYRHERLEIIEAFYDVLG